MIHVTVHVCLYSQVDIHVMYVMYFCVFTGGGFGGKETRTAVLVMPAAVAAYK